MNRVFIGYDSREVRAAEVCAKSILRRTSKPVEVEFLRLNQLGLNRPMEPDQSSEFTYTRFLVPHLTNFQGAALYLDSDMLVLGDISELFDRYNPSYALAVVKNLHVPTRKTKKNGKVQTIYPRKNWSSLMLMNCAKLLVWSKQAVEEQPGPILQRLSYFSDEEIGALPDEWNCLDIWQPSTKLLHYTSGGPWIAGCEDHPYAQLWLDEERA